MRGGVKLVCVHGRCWAAAFAVAGLRAQVWPAGLAGRVRAGRRSVQAWHGRTFFLAGVHKDLRGELEKSANDNYYEPAKPLQTPSPISVAQRCTAIEARLREKQFHKESSTATVSPSSVTDPRQHAQQTLDS